MVEKNAKNLVCLAFRIGDRESKTSEEVPILISRLYFFYRIYCNPHSTRLQLSKLSLDSSVKDSLNLNSAPSSGQIS